MSVCVADECERPTGIRGTGRGLCGKHYQRWWKASGGRAPRPSVADRFWPKVDKGGPIPEHRPELGPCWLWTGARIPAGYGHVSVDGQRVLAHRWSYIDAHGAPAQHLTDIDHLCFVKACVRPDHLEAVTHAENSRRSAARRTR